MKIWTVKMIIMTLKKTQAPEDEESDAVADDQESEEEVIPNTSKKGKS